MGEQHRKAQLQARFVPTKMDGPTLLKIFEAVESGAPAYVAAQYAGISEATLRSWIKKGKTAQIKVSEGEELRKGEDIYLRFMNKLDKVSAACEIAEIEFIRKAAAVDWKAAAWLLERRSHRRWNKTEVRQVQGADGGAVQVQHNWADVIKATIDDVSLDEEQERFIEAEYNEVD